MSEEMETVFCCDCGKECAEWFRQRYAPWFYCENCAPDDSKCVTFIDEEGAQVLTDEIKNGLTNET